jgi:hypothetical protein
MRLDGFRPDHRVVDPHRRVRGPQPNRHVVGPLQPLAPHHQDQRPVALLQQQVMHGGRLLREGVSQSPCSDDLAPVGQDRREVVQVGRRLARRVVRLEEPEGLVAGLVRAVAQQVDRGVTPAPLELGQVHAHQV